jgi:hypothetical protein
MTDAAIVFIMLIGLSLLALFFGGGGGLCVCVGNVAVWVDSGSAPSRSQ